MLYNFVGLDHVSYDIFTAECVSLVCWGGGGEGEGGGGRGGGGFSSRRPGDCVMISCCCSHRKQTKCVCV